MPAPRAGRRRESRHPNGEQDCFCIPGRVFLNYKYLLPNIYKYDNCMLLQMPLPRGNNVLDYSRWQQNLIGVLQPNIAYQTNLVVEPHTVLTIDARLAYRNKGDADNDWKYYKSALEERHLDCFADNVSEVKIEVMITYRFSQSNIFLSTFLNNFFFNI